MGENLFMVCQQGATVISTIRHLFSFTISEHCIPSWCSILHRNVHSVWHLHQIQICQKVSAKISWWNSSQKTIHNLVNKLQLMRLLTDKKQKYMRRELIGKKLNDKGDRLELFHFKCYGPWAYWLIGKIRMPFAAAAHQSLWSTESWSGQARTSLYINTVKPPFTNLIRSWRSFVTRNYFPHRN
jgi:hypothetical protein